MIAVCNTSPISCLLQIGHLALLENPFTERWIPPEVALELEEGVRPDRALLEALRLRARFRISDDVVRRALELAGE